MSAQSEIPKAHLPLADGGGPGALPDARDPRGRTSPGHPFPGFRPTWAEIDLGALAHNFHRVRAASPSTAVLGVVKADAYGHGAVPCARTLEREGAQMLGVALVEEGLELRAAGIAAPILVLGGAFASAEAQVIAAGLTPVIFRPDQVEAFDRAASQAHRRLAVHLKLETGMGRIGAQEGDLDALIRSLRGAKSLELEGVLSHFANADLADQAMTRQQLERFREAYRALRAGGFDPRWRHLSNSAGVLALPEARDGSLYTLVRPGIMLYGEVPAESMRSAADVRPVLSWKTQVTHVKTVAAGTPISYGGRWVAPRESRIATLPVGYADGYSRRFSRTDSASSGGVVLVRGRRAPIAGTVCMDMCMVDVTGIPEVQLGDEVVLIGSQGAERVSASELAGLCGTIHYEIFCAISARVPRVVVGQGS